MNPIGSISNLSGDLLIVVIAGLVFIEESGVPVPFAPGDLLLMIGGIAIASDTVDPVPMVAALLLATVIGAMIGRENFATVGQPAVMKVADTLRFRPALERAIHLLRRGGAPAVFAGRLIPGLRIHTTQAAGVSNMPRVTFAAGLVPSVLVYIAFFVGLGALVGQPAVRLFHRAEHRFFVIAVTTLATLAVVPSLPWLARRGALAARGPILLPVAPHLGISVYGPEGGVPGWWRAALRNLIGLLVFLWPIDAFLLLRTARRQRLGDLAVSATVRRVST